MIQNIRVVERSEQEIKFQEKMETFIEACEKINRLWYAAGHTSGSPVDDLLCAVMGMAMYSGFVHWSHNGQRGGGKQ